MPAPDGRQRRSPPRFRRPKQPRESRTSRSRAGRPRSSWRTSRRLGGSCASTGDTGSGTRSPSPSSRQTALQPGDEYRLELDRKAQRDLARVGRADWSRLRERISRLAGNPRPDGVVKLWEQVYRVRVGRWRVIYLIDDRERRVVVNRVRRREKDTYRR
ncbi:MAG: hypothetical protein F4210_04170 [Holophagales bacterium]|nr:hypothetical protein [Holophagales bacterium]MYF94700.1 hypothetical protein [Holophagales bacterium]